MDLLLKKLTSTNPLEIVVTLERYLQEILPRFSFPELDEDSYRVKLWKALQDILKNENFKSCHRLCLQIIRIISREKKDLNELVTKELLHLILYHAALEGDKSITETTNSGIAVDALMCLCNITFNAVIPRELCSRNSILEKMLKRLNMGKDIASDIKFFDMKIFFIITALCESSRPKLKDELLGVRCLTQYLESTVNELRESNHNADVKDETNKLSIINTNITIEVLKSLFNLMMRPKHQNIIEEEEEFYYLKLVVILRNLLLIKTEKSDRKFDLDGHIIHVLLNVPDQCLKPLIPPIQDNESISSEIKYEHYNMSALYEMLQYLRSRFAPEPGIKDQNEILSPVLTAMLKLAKCDRIMRKYLRLHVLPPLRDIHTRPEQGNTLRNCLCRLLTSPITNVRDLAADFIFILCKENVGRMIKYTGYGNAAGMFASKGLLNGANGQTQNYSSASEDSDTEEYNEYKHGINPVTGCYQAPKPSPTAHMTEEQKEYEAMKLVELMDNLTRKGVVKPCRIGPDGKPEPIEHVLQLQEDLPRQQVHRNDSDEE